MYIYCILKYLFSFYSTAVVVFTVLFTEYSIFCFFIIFPVGPNDLLIYLLKHEIKEDETRQDKTRQNTAI